MTTADGLIWPTIKIYQCKIHCKNAKNVDKLHILAYMRIPVGASTEGFCEINKNMCLYFDRKNILLHPVSV